ncbi:MAG TPA: AI-2E family transporter [Thermoleophilaceae bacterium]|nr:AI-2E family transporter [Thermoleophilaceae bacterium]
MIWRRDQGRPRRSGPRGDEAIEVDVRGLSGVFAAPGWLRDVGITSWLLVGATLLIAGLVWLLSLTQTIVMPLIAAGIVAAVASPLVSFMARHRIPRAAGAALLMLTIVLVVIAMVVIIVAGIASETSSISSELKAGADTVEGWLQDLGVDKSAAGGANKDASDSLSSILPTLLHGVAKGIASLSSLVFFLSLAALSLFFLLKDGPQIRAWSERHWGVPEPVAHVISERTLGALRGYFLGVTAVATFNGVVVGLGAWLLGVPLAGTIAIVTFVGAYIPYLGAWSAGAFSVVIALGGAGADAAAGMIVLQLLANGVLQQLIQPVAYGAALGIHPLAVLVVTIGGGCLFGAAGLILAAPVTSAIARISADLAKARAREAAEEAPPPGGPAPSPT